MGDLIKIAISTLNEHFERQSERLKKRNDEDYDEGVEEQLVEEDDEDTYTLSKLGDLVHALFAAYKEAFLPCFEQLLPYATKLLVSTKSSTFSKPPIASVLSGLANLEIGHQVPHLIRIYTKKESLKIFFAS